MTLQLKNIGMIKEANVKIDGLTVIAGENDTGKSTLGKALFLCLEAQDNKRIDIDSLYYSLFRQLRIDLKDNAFIKLKIKDNESEINNKIPFIIDIINNFSITKNIFIETPLVWNFTDFFRDIAQVESQMRIELFYPYLMKDLNFKLHIKSASDGLDIKKQITNLMGGEFKKDEMGRYYFDKKGQRIELVNTATGIKYFGLFQVLSQNKYLNEETVLILDEPEVHLHPKWQLEMAKIIVELVKNGVKIVVNSHSPYMIQALIKYARDEEDITDKSNFYLATKEEDYATFENVNNDLNKIFELLAEPMNEVFEL